MRELRHLRPEDARRVPWRNGRGVTEELAIWPPEASFARGDFDARISLSSVDEAGPFSPFPGFDRLLIVTRGSGLRLAHGGSAPPADVVRFRPHAFAGEWSTTAELPGGPVDDFNVIVRRGRMRVNVRALRLAEAGACGPIPLDGAPAMADAPHELDLLAHVPSGRAFLHITGHPSPIRLGPRESLLVRGAAVGDALTVIPSSDADAAADAILLVHLARP